MSGPGLPPPFRYDGSCPGPWMISRGLCHWTVQALNMAGATGSDPSTERSSTPVWLLWVWKWPLLPHSGLTLALLANLPPFYSVSPFKRLPHLPWNQSLPSKLSPCSGLGRATCGTIKPLLSHPQPIPGLSVPPLHLPAVWAADDINSWDLLWLGHWCGPHNTTFKYEDFFLTIKLLRNLQVQQTMSGQSSSPTWTRPYWRDFTSF